jgi:ribosomal protein L37AE/L43A
VRPEDERAFLLFHRELPGAQPWGPTCKQCNGSTTYERHASSLGLCKECEQSWKSDLEEKLMNKCKKCGEHTTYTRAESVLGLCFKCEYNISPSVDEELSDKVIGYTEERIQYLEERLERVEAAVDRLLGVQRDELE